MKLIAAINSFELKSAKCDQYKQSLWQIQLYFNESVLVLKSGL